MDTPNTQNWRQDLLGREEEMEWLQNAWKEAVNGKPQIRVFTAESGYGKTKIVHSFYAWLAAHHDPKEYWPKLLPVINESLELMPALPDTYKEAEIPWFWWGSRCEKPEGHNRTLGLDVTALMLTKERPSFERQLNSLSAKLDNNKALGEASLGALKAVLALIPPVAAVSSFISGLSDLKDSINILYSLKKNHSLRDNTIKINKSKIEEFIAKSSIILGNNFFGGNGLPMVLILDDAQWADPNSLTMIRNLWKLANKEKWKLLIIGTHWERNWNEQILSEPEENSFAAWLAKLPNYRIRTNSTPFPQSDLSNVEQWRLGKLEEVDKLLRKSFKGLTEEQIKMFTERVSGNPRHMQEVIIKLRDKRTQWFVGSNLDMPLKEDGFKDAMNCNLELEDLEEQRFDRTADEIKQMIGAGSAQGARFINHFAGDVAAKLGLGMDNLKLLEEAIDPLVLVERCGLSCTEFRSRTIHECAKTFIKNTEGAERIARAILQTSCEWSNSGQLGELSEDLSSRLFSLTHDYATKHPEQIEDVESLFAMYFVYGERQYSEFCNSYAAYYIYQLAIDLACAIESSCGATEKVRHLHAKAVCLMGNLGNHDESYPPASEHFKTCYELCEDNLKMFGETPVTLRDSCRMAMNIGYMHKHARCLTEAEAYFSKALELSNLLISKYGSTSESLFEKIRAIHSLEQTSDLFYEQPKIIDQLQDIQDSSAEHVERMVSSLNFAASGHEKIDELEIALAMRKNSLLLVEKMIVQEGETAARSISLIEQHHFLIQLLKRLSLSEDIAAALKRMELLSNDYLVKYPEDLSWHYVNDQMQEALNMIDYSEFDDDPVDMTEEELADFINPNQESIGL